MRFELLVICALATTQALAQAGFPPPPPKVSPAAGVIDMHVHSHPDVFGRNMDDIDIAQLAKAKGLRGILVAPGGQVTPEMEAILKIIARENLVLATGHVHPEEIIAVVRRGRELGVKNIVITHGLTNVPGLTMAQAKQVVDMGAVIEVCFLQFRAGPNAPLAFLTHWTQINAKNVAQAVKMFGAQGLVISSDLGQSGNMTHPDGIEAAIAEMKREGISDADIDIMMRKNP